MYEGTYPEGAEANQPANDQYARAAQIRERDRIRGNFSPTQTNGPISPVERAVEEIRESQKRLQSVINSLEDRLIKAGVVSSRPEVSTGHVGDTAKRPPAQLLTQRLDGISIGNQMMADRLGALIERLEL